MIFPAGEFVRLRIFTLYLKHSIRERIVNTKIQARICLEVTSDCVFRFFRIRSENAQ